MRTLVLSLSLVVVTGAGVVRPAYAFAQDPAPELLQDTVGLARTVAGARAALRDLPAIWGISGDTVEWLFVTPDRAWATERRGGRDRIAPFTVPTGTTRANTSVDIDGQRWAMVLLPLGGDHDARVRLLVHEATHTFQPQLLPNPGNTETGEGGDLLDTEPGRLWLFLELRAIARAITTSGEARRVAARDALLFRAQRDSLAVPEERARWDRLDIAEGIPEYTGWRLSGASATELGAHLDSAATRGVSWVRGVAYDTGPAYGFLLDALAGSGWRDAAREGRRFPTLLTVVLGSTPFTEVLDARAKLYGGDLIRRDERARTITRAARLDTLRTRFVRGPVLRLIPRSLRISFDPNGQYPVDDVGTVMMNFRWAADDGAELVAALGALVPPSWTYVQVPLGDVRLETGTIAEQRVIEGNGWRLTLPPGWRVSRSGGRVEVRPPA